MCDAFFIFFRFRVSAGCSVWLSLGYVLFHLTLIQCLNSLSMQRHRRPAGNIRHTMTRAHSTCESTAHTSPLILSRLLVTSCDVAFACSILRPRLLSAILEPVILRSSRCQGWARCVNGIFFSGMPKYSLRNPMSFPKIITTNRSLELFRVARCLASGALLAPTTAEHPHLACF